MNARNFADKQRIVKKINQRLDDLGIGYLSFSVRSRISITYLRTMLNPANPLPHKPVNKTKQKILEATKEIDSSLQGSFHSQLFPPLSSMFVQLFEIVSVIPQANSSQSS